MCVLLAACDAPARTFCLEQQHAYCGFKVTKSCIRALVTENVDRDAIEREQAASREAARKAREAVEAAALKLAADKLDEERRLRKIYGKDWQRHSKLQPASRVGGQAKNQAHADGALDDEKPTYVLLVFCGCAWRCPHAGLSQLNLSSGA